VFSDIAAQSLMVARDDELVVILLFAEPFIEFNCVLVGAHVGEIPTVYEDVPRALRQRGDSCVETVRV